MKPASLILLILLLPLAGTAQPYSCEAPDSVLAMYRDDADRLALARTFRNGGPWADSVAIDPAWARTALGALVAVHGSTSPARDSVIDLYDIHVFPWISLRSFIVSADTALPWLHQLQVGTVPTGDPVVDQLMAAWGTGPFAIMNWPPASHRTIVFETDSNRNITALSARWALLPGVAWAEPNNGCCDGSTITDSVHTDHVELTWSYGWGDCPAGCTARHYWVFNVLPDCTVDDVGSHGTPIDVPTGTGGRDADRLRIRPNPVADILHMEGKGANGQVMVHAMDGRAVLRVRPQGGTLDVSSLPPGLYVLRHADLPDMAPVRFEVLR